MKIYKENCCLRKKKPEKYLKSNLGYGVGNDRCQLIEREREREKVREREFFYWPITMAELKLQFSLHICRICAFIFLNQEL